MGEGLSRPISHLPVATALRVLSSLPSAITRGLCCGGAEAGEGSTACP